MTKLTDRLGTQFLINYLNCTWVSSMNDPIESISFSYDAINLKTTVSETVSGSPRATVYAFDAVGNIKDITANCCNYHLHYDYDAMRNIIHKTDPNNNNTNYTYDSRGDW